MIPTPEFPAAALTYNELIFQSRLRDYGAFDLRQNYQRTLTWALGSGIGLFVVGLLLPILYAQFRSDADHTHQQTMVETTLIKLPETPAKPPIRLPPTQQMPSVKTIRSVPPVVVPEADVVEDVLPPTVNEMKDAVSGPTTTDGDGDISVIAPPERSAPTVAEKAIEVTPKTDDVFIRVEQQPEYPGGTAALRQFLVNNLTYPRAASSAGVSGRVYVSFVVNTDGSLADVQVLKGIGFGCDEEAVRVIHKMPKWRPGKQSGRAVRVKFNLPISFSLE